MSDLEKLAAARVARIEDNLAARPIDVLRSAAHDVETGKIKCTGVLIIMVDQAPPEVWGAATLRAGLSWKDEMTALQLELFRHLCAQYGVKR